MFEYAKRLSEVDVIINLLPKEDYEKIPQDLIKMIRDNKDNDYLWEYDERKTQLSNLTSRNTQEYHETYNSLFCIAGICLILRRRTAPFSGCQESGYDAFHRI